MIVIDSMAIRISNSKVVEELAEAAHETTFFSLLFLSLPLFLAAERPPEPLLREHVVVPIEWKRRHPLAVVVVMVMVVVEPHPSRRDLANASVEHLRIEVLALASQNHVVAVRYLAAAGPRVHHRLHSVAATADTDTEGVGTHRRDVAVHRTESHDRQRQRINGSRLGFWQILSIDFSAGLLAREE